MALQLKSFIKTQNKKLTGLICLIYVLVAVILPMKPVSAVDLPTIRVNTGGGAYTDNMGIAWAADHSYSGGYTSNSSNPINGTDNDSLYQTERWNWGAVAPEMTYSFAVPAGGYRVKLHFAETYALTSYNGGRVFDVGIENKTVLDDFDIHSQAGANTALVKSFGAAVADGTLNIRFTNGSANNPTVSAIEIIGQDPYSIRVNSGGPAYTDPQGKTWLADQNYNTGVTNSTTAAIDGTSSDTLYQTERWDAQDGTPLQYNFPVPNGLYRVKLHFAEIYGLTSFTGGRVFNTSIENSPVLTDFDIFKEVGANKALVKEFTNYVTDGQLNISFDHGAANNPKVSAIEVIKMVSSDAWPEYHIVGPGQKVDMMIVGDSYSSGNGGSADGTPNSYYFKSADDPRIDSLVRHKSETLPGKDCYRHHNNWGEYAYNKTRAVYGNVGSFVNVACSGDVAQNITGTNGNAPQLEGFGEYNRNSMDLIALTIGGNDLGFVDIVVNCFMAKAGQACEQKMDAAEAMMQPVGAPGTYSMLQLQIYAALHKLKTEWPNAKIVLVGYPMLWEDRDLALGCPNCEANPVMPGQRLEEGVNMLNAQQQRLIDDFNTTSPGRFAFMPLHNTSNQGFYDGHGLHGNQTAWIHNPEEGVTPLEWFHPNAAGYSAIGENLFQLPMVQQLFK